VLLREALADAGGEAPPRRARKKREGF
jgi:hypothetical protein